MLIDNIQKILDDYESGKDIFNEVIDGLRLEFINKGGPIECKTPRANHIIIHDLSKEVGARIYEELGQEALKDDIFPSILGNLCYQLGQGVSQDRETAKLIDRYINKESS